MHRRAYVRTLLVGAGCVVAGCSGSSLDGRVEGNDTPLALTHEYAMQSTLSGLRVVVDVMATNAGSEPISPTGRVPRVTCTFTDSAGATIHSSGLELRTAVRAGESVALEFTLAVDVDDVAGYALGSEWVES